MRERNFTPEMVRHHFHITVRKTGDIKQKTTHTSHISLETSYGYKR